MKKIISVLLVIILLLTACSSPSEPIDEQPEINEPGSNGPSEPIISEPENELGEGSRVLEGCIFKTSEEKYGVQKDGKIILPATYDEFKRIGELGGKIFYALGFKDGTKRCIEWNEDGTFIGTTETERTLYDIFDYEGNMLLSFPVDDFYNEDEKVLHVTLEGSKYYYTFSDEGEIINEDIYEKGKDWPNLFGFDAVKYYYDASPFNPYWGLADSEGNVVIPEIYTEFKTYFGNRLVAFTHTGMVGYSAFRLYDNKCNLLCEKYSYIEYYQLSDGSYIGIGKIDYPEHQSPLICRDENGEILPGGLWFVDENGNALSERFDIDMIDIEFSAEDKLAFVKDIEGNVTEIPIGDYIIEKDW